MPYPDSLLTLGAVALVLFGSWVLALRRKHHRDAHVRQTLQNCVVAQMMNRQPLAIPGEWPLDRVHAQFFRSGALGTLAVVDGDRLLGQLHEGLLNAVPRAQWGRKTAREIAEWLPAERMVAPETSAALAYALLRSETDALLVIQGGRLLGSIRAAELRAFADRLRHAVRAH